MNESNMQFTNAERSANEAPPCQNSPIEASPHKTPAPEDSPPEFGLIDVIEAFTAMRHEWRQQTRENRELAATIESTAQKICQFEDNLTSNLIGTSDVEFESGTQPTSKNVIADHSLNEMVDAIVEFDIYLTRAVEAASTAQALGEKESTLASAIQTTYHNMNFLSRWICKNFYFAVHELVKVDQHSASGQAPSDSIVEGLVLLLSRLRRIMVRHQIVRREAVGQPFDAALMRAIGTMPPDPERPAITGHVVEQLTPTYSWNGNVIRFAEVRVAQ